MTYNSAKDAFDTMAESGQRREVGAVMGLAIEYARLRVDHLVAAADQEMAISRKRTLAHNALIAAINELADAMEQAHEDTLWRETMGQDRKDIGDFACYVHCFLGIEAR